MEITTKDQSTNLSNQLNKIDINLHDFLQGVKLFQKTFVNKNEELNENLSDEEIKQEAMIQEQNPSNLFPKPDLDEKAKNQMRENILLDPSLKKFFEQDHV